MSAAPSSPQVPTIEVSDIDRERRALTFVPALIVIDMQNDFVSGSLAIAGAETIISAVNATIDLPWKIRIATRDFHPDNHVSFAHTHEKPEFSKKTIFHPQDKLNSNGVEQTLWPIHCVADTTGAEFVPGLNTTAFDAVVFKGTHAHIESYSAFKDIWGKDTTELPGLIEAAGVTDVFIVGLAGDYCVKYTAIDSLELGYRTWLITDGIKSIASEDEVYKELSSKGIRLTNLQDVKTRFQADSLN